MQHKRSQYWHCLKSKVRLRMLVQYDLNNFSLTTVFNLLKKHKTLLVWPTKMLRLVSNEEATFIPLVLLTVPERDLGLRVFHHNKHSPDL